MMGAKQELEFTGVTADYAGIFRIMGGQGGVHAGSNWRGVAGRSDIRGGTNSRSDNYVDRAIVLRAEVGQRADSGD